MIHLVFYMEQNVSMLLEMSRKPIFRFQINVFLDIEDNKTIIQLQLNTHAANYLQLR